MVKMLVAVSGLAGPTDRLRVEKIRGQMARECDVCVAKAGEQANTKAAVKAAEKRQRQKAVDDEKVEAARLQQAEAVRVKEAARVAAEAERDRLVKVVKACTEGPMAVAAVETVVEAARTVVEPEREVAAEAMRVEIGGWQGAGGRKRKTVKVATQLCRPQDAERRKALQGAIAKVQELLGAANLEWGLVASPYTVNTGDEVLWMVRGVGGVNGSEVTRTVMRNLEAVWGVGTLVGCWIENKMSAYVVVRGIPKREWLSDKKGVQGLVEGNSGTMWGPRQPVVISRAWNRVDVKLESMRAEAAKGAVMRGLAYCGMRRTVHMAVGGGGASMARTDVMGNAPPRVPVIMPGARRVSRDGGSGNVRPGRTLAGNCFRCGRAGHWKNECGRSVVWTIGAASHAGGVDMSVGTAQGELWWSWILMPRVLRAWQRGRSGRSMDRRRSGWCQTRRPGIRQKTPFLTTNGYGKRWRKLRSRRALWLRVHKWGVSEWHI